MDCCNLILVTEEEKKGVLEHFDLSEEELEEYIQHLVEWRIKSGFNDDLGYAKNHVRNALLNCKLSTEKTKATIKGYYRARVVCSHFYSRLIPFSEDYNLCKSLGLNVIMPKLTPDLCRIYINKICDPEGKIQDGTVYFMLMVMEGEIRIASEDFVASNIMIIDLEEFGLYNLLKFSPRVAQTFVNLLLGFNVRLKNLHMINAPTFVDKILTMLRPFLPAKIMSKIRTHTTYETLYEYVSKDHLPSNYGGKQPSLEQLQEEWCKFIESQENYFKNMLEYKYDHLIETNTESNDSFGMGCEGSFKKICVD